MLIIYMAVVWDFSFMREVRNRCSPINLTLTKRPRAQRLLRCKGTRTENSTSASASPPALLLGPLPFSQPQNSKVRNQSNLRPDWCPRVDAALRIPGLGSTDTPSHCCVLGIPQLWARPSRGAHTLPSAGGGTAGTAFTAAPLWPEWRKCFQRSKLPPVFLFWNGCSLEVVVYIHIYIALFQCCHPHSNLESKKKKHF